MSFIYTEHDDTITTLPFKCVALLQDESLYFVPISVAVLMSCQRQARFGSVVDGHIALLCDILFLLIKIEQTSL
jgi:hypothetical protein